MQTDVCYSRCGEEFGHPCQRFCPAHVYEMVEEAGRKRLQINAANWFLGSSPDAVIASGGLYRFPENREVYDHVYVTFEYPGGRTAVFSSIESNAFHDYYEMYLGTTSFPFIVAGVHGSLSCAKSDTAESTSGPG